MSTDIQPQPAELLHHTQHAQSAVEEQLDELNTRSFNGTDEAKTVGVTLDGRQRLTGLYIEDGLLRLGIEAVGQRINEAINNAHAAAAAAFEAEQQQFAEFLAEAAGSLNDITQANPG
jgi:DNA-binding protein YbaB